MEKLTDELRTRSDDGFRPGLYVLYTVDQDELPDGVWVVFPPKTPVKLAHGLIEAGHSTMQKFADAGLEDELRNLQATRHKNA